MTLPRPPEPTKDILNIEEAALLLGVSLKTFAKVLRDGEVPGRKIGREWKFARHALIEWVAKGRSRDFFDADDRADDEAAEPAAAELARSDGHAARTGAGRRAAPSPAHHEMSIEED